MPKPDKKKPAPVPIAPAAMQIEPRPIDSITPYARNARHITAAAIAKVAASLREFGWRQPIVVDAKGVIVVGHARYLAARQLGYAEVPVHVAADLKPSQIKAYRLMDNRSHEEAGWNNEILGIELLELKVEQFDTDLTGFEPEQIIESIFGDGQKRKRGDEMSRDETADLKESFQVLVTCQDEEQHAALLQRLSDEGFECRALIS